MTVQWRKHTPRTEALTPDHTLHITQDSHLQALDYETNRPIHPGSPRRALGVIILLHMAQGYHHLREVSEIHRLLRHYRWALEIWRRSNTQCLSDKRYPLGTRWKWMLRPEGTAKLRVVTAHQTDSFKATTRMCRAWGACKKIEQLLLQIGVMSKAKAAITVQKSTWARQQLSILADVSQIYSTT